VYREAVVFALPSPQFLFHFFLGSTCTVRFHQHGAVITNWNDIAVSRLANLGVLWGGGVFISAAETENQFQSAQLLELLHIRCRLTQITNQRSEAFLKS